MCQDMVTSCVEECKLDAKLVGKANTQENKHNSGREGFQVRKEGEDLTIAFFKTHKRERTQGWRLNKQHKGHVDASIFLAKEPIYMPDKIAM